MLGAAPVTPQTSERDNNGRRRRPGTGGGVGALFFWSTWNARHLSCNAQRRAGGQVCPGAPTT